MDSLLSKCIPETVRKYIIRQNVIITLAKHLPRSCAEDCYHHKPLTAFTACQNNMYAEI
jgi:hypothetical protein